MFQFSTNNVKIPLKEGKYSGILVPYTVWSMVDAIGKSAMPDRLLFPIRSANFSSVLCETLSSLTTNALGSFCFCRLRPLLNDHSDLD